MKQTTKFLILQDRVHNSWFRRILLKVFKYYITFCKSLIWVWYEIKDIKYEEKKMQQELPLSQPHLGLVPYFKYNIIQTHSCMLLKYLENN